MTISISNGLANTLSLSSPATSANPIQGNPGTSQSDATNSTAFQQLLQQTLQMVLLEETNSMESMVLGDNTDTSGASNMDASLMGGLTSPTSGTSSSLPDMTSLLSLLPNYLDPSAAAVSSTTGTVTGTPNSGIDTAASQAIQPLVQAASQQYGIPTSLLNAVIQQESGFNANSVSSAGAVGLMQLMPETSQSLGVTNPLDPAQNINGGAAYLSQLLTQFHGNVSLALAAYNAGPGAVQSYGGIPPYAETQSYVKNILAMAGQSPTMTG